MTLGNSQIKLLKVSDFAEICQVTERTIRFYEKEGVLEPKKIDRGNKYRYYLQDQSLEVFRIKLLQEFGYSLEEIKNISTTKAQSLKDQLNDLKKIIDEKRREYKFLKYLTPLLFQKNSFEGRMKTEEVGDFWVFGMRILGGDYLMLEEYFQKLRKKAEEIGIKSIGEMTIYLEDEYKPKGTDMEVCLISKDIKQDCVGEFFMRKIKKTKIIYFEFEGPYRYLPLIHQRFIKVVRKGVYKLKGSGFEIYTKVSKNEYGNITKIGYPIE